MEIINKNISEIKPYEHNPRRNDEAVQYVASSIAEFGFKVPIVIDKDGEIVAGHTRYKAAQKLGIEEVPCIIADDLTDAQVKAFRLADNKVAEIAEWDYEMLEGELLELNSLDFDMSDFGFEDITEGIEPSTDDIIEDEPPEPPEEPKSRLGDIYQLGEHRVMCGDSTDKEAVSKLMDGEKADIVFTDPPYGMNLDTDFSGMQNHLDFAKEKSLTGGKKYEQGNVDEFHPEMIDAVFAIDTDEMFLWGADYFAELLPNKNDGSWIVWDKRANGNNDVTEDYSSDKMFGSCFELCWSKKKHKREIARIRWAGIFGMEQEFDKRRVHPTQKPIKLATWFLTKYSEPGDKVIDLFGGSGSTLIAAEQLGRKCYMMELDPHYVDVIVERWENFTGKKAEKITGDN